MIPFPLLVSLAVAGMSLGHAPEGVHAPERAASTPVVCGAAPPARGERFSGPVLHVFDGGALCIAQGPTPRDWIRVELPPEARTQDRRVVMAAVFAKRLDCVASRSGSRRVIAHCSLNGIPLRDLLQSPRVLAEAPLWR